MSHCYESLRAMLDARGIEREDGFDFGSWWFDADRVPHRLTWIGPQWHGDAEDPGELYLLRHHRPETVELLCVIPPRTDGLVDGAVEEILDGWAEACGNLNSVDWVRDRVREAIEAGWAVAP